VAVVSGLLTVADGLELWAVADVMAYLKCGRSTVYRYMADPDFPKAIRHGRGHPRWLKAEVVAWWMRLRDAKAA
jgi:predicted DNA-binding transcriptional regulator AlpA